MVTIKMVAQRCGLSTAAVSRALNGQSGVSAEKAAWVRQVAEEMGYRPNAVARALKTNRTRIIGVLYRNRMAHEFFSVVLEGIREEAERQGYEIAFLNTAPEGSYYQHARQRLCEGVIVAQGLFSYEGVMELMSSPMPTVAIEYTYPGGTTIFTDNVGAMEEIVRYLHGMGHRRIALIHGEHCQITQERLAGFYRGCRKCGLEVPEEYIRPGRFRDADLAAEETRRLLALPNPPSCILYPDDISYLGGMGEIEQQGLSIPADVSCFGFDGISMTRALRPRLSTYYQNGEEMGRRAAQEVISAIEDPRTYVPRTILVSGHIQQGDTVLRIPEENGATV